MQCGDSPEGRLSMSWADKARGFTPVLSSCPDEKERVLPPLQLDPDGDESDNNNDNRHIPSDAVDSSSGGLAGTLQGNTIFALPVDTWDVISSFLNFREVQMVSCTCRFFWSRLHARENIWRDQLNYFHHDMADLRGDGRLLCMDALVPTDKGAYERMKFERKLYAIDTRRDWHFREREREGRRDGVFSCPLTFLDEENSEVRMRGDDNWDRDVVPLSHIRILRPLLESSGDGTPQGTSQRSTFTPGEYITLCDSINHNDFTGSRLTVRDCTSEETDEMFLFALLQTFRRAKRRPPPRRSPSDSRTSHHLMLRRFSGQLLSICRYEAEQILRSILHMPRLLDDFVIFNNSTLRELCNPTSMGHPTRYFIAPELCRDGRMALVAVDPLRLMVTTGKERMTRDDPSWDDARITAVEEGRVVHGSGMNPQQVRRM